MVGCHYQLDGHEFKQAPGVVDGQGSLAPKQTLRQVVGSKSFFAGVTPGSSVPEEGAKVD